MSGTSPTPNKVLIEWIMVAAAVGKHSCWSTGMTELDSHANMLVIGKQGTIIQQTGWYADVNAFSKDVAC